MELRREAEEMAQVRHNLSSD
eukprot:SAG11_NODE_22481_length_405_cov_1.065359_1_plen_20_part_10